MKSQHCGFNPHIPLEVHAQTVSDFRQQVHLALSGECTVPPLVIAHDHHAFLSFEAETINDDFVLETLPNSSMGVQQRDEPPTAEPARHSHLADYRRISSTILHRVLVCVTARFKANAECHEVGAVYDEAGCVSNEAGSVFNEAGSVFNEAGAVSNEAGAASNEAGAVFNEAGAASNEAGSVFNEAGAATVVDDGSPRLICANILESVVLGLCLELPPSAHRPATPPSPLHVAAAAPQAEEGRSPIHVQATSIYGRHPSYRSPAPQVEVVSFDQVNPVWVHQCKPGSRICVLLRCLQRSSAESKAPALS
jgi:hypothetical protein